MIRISVFYPNRAGAKFDLDYYAQKHLALVEQRLKAEGLVRWEIDKGLAGPTPDAAAPFVAIGHLYFNSMEEFQKAFAAHAAEIMADIPNYTDIEPQIQISEVIG